jgi:hypothetical protein
MSADVGRNRNTVFLMHCVFDGLAKGYIGQYLSVDVGSSRQEVVLSSDYRCGPTCAEVCQWVITDQPKSA